MRLVLNAMSEVVSVERAGGCAAPARMPDITTAHANTLGRRFEIWLDVTGQRALPKPCHRQSNQASLSDSVRNQLSRRDRAMTYTTDDDIFERALLRLLHPDPMPSTQGVQASIKNKRCRTKRSIAHRIQTAERITQPAQIFVLEVLSANTLSVCWSDPRAGRYAEQVWRSGFARNGAYCALSGKPIVQGDKIFRPGRSFVCPANWDRMMLASEVQTGISSL